MIRFSALCIPFLLAACGGGSSAFNAYGNEANILLDRYETAENTRPVDFPSIDSATYSGVAAGAVGFDTPSEEAFAGALSVDVNFVVDSFSGEITDMVNEFNESIGGQVDMAGTVDTSTSDTFAQLDGVLTGVITTPDGLVTDVDGVVGGNFVGVGAPAIALFGEGETTNFLGTDSFFLVGIAER